MDLTNIIHTGLHPLASGRPPAWASGWGQDTFGVFTEIHLETPGDWRGVTQRLRWIPPGRFMMGSPEDEPGRRNDEGPETDIMFSQGYWLFDTPVTQALYETVTGENPSEFQSPTRPVEHVSWKDAQDFIAALSGRFEGLDLRLPSEAEWEYACRAGTETATYAGPLDIRGKRNAPGLDEIAWYGGNCGRDWDLDTGWGISGWAERQYDDPQGGTHPVALKRANGLGLYDMLGNVWEWCEDMWHESHEDAAPMGVARQASKPDGVRYRVIRGGSWLDRARLLRAACRYRNDPANRLDDIGFRCAGGQVASTSQPPAGSPGREAEPRPGAAGGDRAQRDQFT